MTTSTLDAPSSTRYDRVLAAATDDLDTHLRRNGPLPWRNQPGRLIGTIEAAGLTGRGGAGFPAWRKLAAVLAAGRKPVVIANGAEGEPASAKDRTLLTVAPHLVLDGLQLAAEAVGAARVFLYVPDALATTMTAILDGRRARGLDRYRVTVVEAPDRFIAGEESAVVSRVEGKEALPRDTPRRVVEHGVRGAPTLVQNVETLAHIALIARHGPDWFRQYGTRDQPGTFLATISGAVGIPGVYEAPYGLPLRGLLELAGGVSAPVQAVLLGGYHGGWLPARAVETPVSRASLAPYGASPGAGVVVALPTDACGLVESARIAQYLAGESAGQCGPCLNGLPQLADTLTRLSRPEPDRALTAQVQRLAGLVNGRGACRHPDGSARFVLSALRVFDDEVRRHLAGGCGSRPTKTGGW